MHKSVTACYSSSEDRRRDYIAQSAPKPAIVRDILESSVTPYSGSTGQSEVFMYVADSDVYVPSYEYQPSATATVASITVGTALVMSTESSIKYVASLTLLQLMKSV